MQRILIGSSLVILCAAVAAAPSPPGTTPGLPSATSPGAIAPGAVQKRSGGDCRARCFKPLATPQTVNPSIKGDAVDRAWWHRSGRAAYAELADAKSLADERHDVQCRVRPQYQQLQGRPPGWHLQDQQRRCHSSERWRHSVGRVRRDRADEYSEEERTRRGGSASRPCLKTRHRRGTNAEARDFVSFFVAPFERLISAARQSVLGYTL